MFRGNWLSIPAFVFRPAPPVAAVAALLSGPALAADDVRIAAAQPGTAWHAFGAVLARQFTAAVPGARAVVVRRGNGYWNPIVVNSRRAEFGLVNAASAVWAYTGDETAYGKKKYTQIRVVMAGLRPVWIAAILREDYLRGSGHSTLERALRAKRGAPRIVMRPANSVVPVVADRILAALGSSRQILRERGGDVLQVGSAQIPSMIRGGRADLYFEAVGKGSARALGTALSDHARFVRLPPAALAALRGAGLEPLPLPPPGQRKSRPVQTVDLGTTIIAHRDVGNETVYRLLEVLVEAREALAGSHPAWRDYAPSPYVALETRGVPMHPGARRYYHERGWPEKARQGPIPIPRPKPGRRPAQ